MVNELLVASKLFLVKPELVDEDQLIYTKKWLQQIDYSVKADERDTKSLFAAPSAKFEGWEERKKIRHELEKETRKIAGRLHGTRERRY